VMVPRSQVFCHSALRWDNKKMAAFARTVVVPMAEQQMLIDSSFHFGIRAFLVAEFVAGIVRASRKNFRGKNNVFVDGRPNSAIGFRGDIRYLLRRAAGRA